VVSRHHFERHDATGQRFGNRVADLAEHRAERLEHPGRIAPSLFEHDPIDPIGIGVSAELQDEPFDGFGELFERVDVQHAAP
jgi:hypothetical protein